MAYVFSALRGKQQGNVYYNTNIEYGEIERLIELPDEDIAGHILADEQHHMMQREMNWARIKGEMSRYLTNNNDAFFSALTLFIVPRNLQPSEEGRDYRYDEETKELRVESSAFLFAGDGQHRAAAIRHAVLLKPELATEDVPVVLLPYEGVPQVRQLFSDLNLNAKKVSPTLGLTFETRDPLAIITKAIGSRVPLFEGRVEERRSQLALRNPNVVSMNALYEGTSSLLLALHGHDVDGAHRKGSLEDTRDQYQGLSHCDPLSGEAWAAAQPTARVWQAIIDALPWDEELDQGKTPGEIREKYVFAHGIGWQAIAAAAGALILAQPTNWEDPLTTALTAIDWRRTNPEWQGLAVIGTRVNNTRNSVRGTAGYILEVAGSDAVEGKMFRDELARLREEWTLEQIKNHAVEEAMARAS